MIIFDNEMTAALAEMLVEHEEELTGGTSPSSHPVWTTITNALNGRFGIKLTIGQVREKVKEMKREEERKKLKSMSMVELQRAVLELQIETNQKWSQVLDKAMPMLDKLSRVLDNKLMRQEQNGVHRENVPRQL